MSLAAGTRLGTYEILDLLGEGGMGQVYRAADTRLKRQVAIKILPQTLDVDTGRRERFTREAQVLAALNHPHIAGIYGIEESSGITALVLELVEGEDLAQRLARGPVPVDEALGYARQMVAALEAAHTEGIIHRDLKPANIKLRRDGTVKILDFGLAKALQAGSTTAVAVAAVSTVASPHLTAAGSILGTPAYMSPEQARGVAADKRADIWALGCVLFEMLAGTSAFPGRDTREVLAAVLEREPDWARLPPALPPVIGLFLRRCLDKDPKQRIHDIADLRLALDGAFDVAAPGDGYATAQWSRRPAWLKAVALVAIAIAALAWFATTRAPSPPAPRLSRLDLTSSESAALTLTDGQRHIAITPDGSRIVYIGHNGTQLFVRPLDTLEPTVLHERYPRGPFVSPDSQWIGFTDTGQLKKVPVSGGAVVTIAPFDAPTARGATWGTDNTIVFATTNGTTGLQRVSASGGDVTVLTRPDSARGEADHFWPEWLPGGRVVLFTIVPATGGINGSRVAAFDLASGAIKVLFSGSHATFVPSQLAGQATGHVLFVTTGTLWAVPFDAERLETIGSPAAVMRDVITTASGDVDAVLSNDGTLAYLSGPPLPEPARGLLWVDRSGQEEVIPAPSRAYVHPRLSPDGTRLAIYTADQSLDVWLADLSRSTLTRVTSGAGVESHPVWSADGRRIVFSSQSESVGNLYWQRADGTGAPERLTDSPNVQSPTGMSPDGRVLLFTENTTATGEDVMQMSMDGARQVTPLVRSRFAERNGIISPDGRWLAFEADDSGRFEIYASPYPNVSTDRFLVSTGGGVRPLWGRGGKELFYVNPSGGIMVVAITPGSTWSAAGPVQRLPEGYFTSPGNIGRTYEVSADGERLLVIRDERPPTAHRFVVVQHWLAELRRLVPLN